jgi:nitroreductase
MDLGEALRTTGSVRAFTDQPVDDSTVAALLDDARFAPSGGNRQPWKVAVVKSSETRRLLGELMRGVWDDYLAIAAGGRTPFNANDASSFAPPPTAETPKVPSELIDNITTIPVVLVIGCDLGKVAMMDYGNPNRPPITAGASIFPFCWNLLLSARAHHLGGVMTTFLSRVEVQAAPLLGLPDGWALAATIFLGHPFHQPTKLKRLPTSDFATVDRFDGEIFH